MDTSTLASISHPKDLIVLLEERRKEVNKTCLPYNQEWFKWVLRKM